MLTTTKAKEQLKAQEGSVLTEFLLVFPAFLLVCMFALECGLWWADKHILRIAAFEAARVFAAAEPADPCNDDETRVQAKAAALRKVAIIAPTVAVFAARLSNATGLPVNVTEELDNEADLPSYAKRLIKRWPVAVASTRIDCEVVGDTLKVEVTYWRSLLTPFVDRLAWMLYHTVTIDSNTGHGNDGMSVHGGPFDVGSPGKLPSERLADVARVKQEITNVLNRSKDLDMSPTETSKLLTTIPFVETVVHRIPTLVSANHAVSFGITGQIDTKIAEANHPNNVIVSSVLLVAPEALRRIPSSVSVSIPRKWYSDTATISGNQILEPYWKGISEGVMKLDGAYRTYGKALTQPSSYISNGEAL